MVADARPLEDAEDATRRVLAALEVVLPMESHMLIAALLGTAESIALVSGDMEGFCRALTDRLAARRSVH